MGIEKFAYAGEAPVQGSPATEIETLFWTHQGVVVHKWLHYLPLYDRYLQPWKNRDLRLLEIGVSKGGSLGMWRRFFGDRAVVFGIDIDENCLKYNGLDGQVRIGSQDDPAFLRRVVAEMGGIDVVIDDGSHVSRHIRASFDVLFPLLSEGGLYIAEDLHTAYWPLYEGGYRRKSSFISVVKTMIDDMHHWYHGFGQQVTAATGHVAALHIHDSIVVVEKRLVAAPRHTHRGSE